MWWCCCRSASLGRRVQGTSGNSDIAASSLRPSALRHPRNQPPGSVNKWYKTKDKKNQTLSQRALYLRTKWEYELLQKWKTQRVLGGRNEHLVKRWIDVPVMWDIHCSFIRHDMCWVNSNQLLNYEPSRPCLHYGGGFPDWLGECLIAALPGTEAWSWCTHTRTYKANISMCTYSALFKRAWISK